MKSSSLEKEENNRILFGYKSAINSKLSYSLQTKNALRVFKILFKHAMYLTILGCLF